MRFKRNYVVVSAITLISLFFPLNCLAQQKFIIKPLVSASWRTDTNYFWAETVEREVFTYLVQPGIELGGETAKAKVVLHYTADLYYFDDQDTIPPGQRPADDDDFVGHTGTLEARYRPFDRLLLGLDDSFYKTREPAQTDRLNNAILRDKYIINRLTPMVFYEFENRFTVGLRYRNSVTDYSNTTNEDSSEHRGMFDLIYNFTRTASLDLEYQYWKKNYDLTTSDYTSNQIKLIFRKQFKYVSFDAGGGFHDRNFDQANVEDIDIVTGRIAISAQNPPAPETPRSHISLSAEHNFNDLGFGDQYFKATRITLDTGLVFLEKLPLKITGYYQKSDYESFRDLTPAGNIELRDDDTFSISASLGYIITDWLTFSITGGLEDRDSNLANRDFENEFFMAKLEFGYSLGSR